MLTRRQTVAEGLPSQSQQLIRHGARNRMLMDMALAILHPSISQEQAVAIFFLISKLAVNQFGILLCGTALYHLVASKDGIDNMQVGIAGTHLNGNGLAVTGELAARGIEPVVGLSSGFRIIKAEHHKFHVEAVTLANGLETMFTALALSIEHRT